MTKTINSLCILLAAIVATPTQARTLGWGITGGMNVTKLNLEEDWQNMTQPQSDKGWYAGVTGLVSVPILGFGFDGSVLYSQEEVSLSKDSEAETAYFVCLPIHLRYDFKFPLMDEIFVPYVMAGPQFNYRFNDLKFAYEEGESSRAILKRTNSWRLDFGLGFILFDRVQCTYSYGIPIGPSCKIQKAGDVVNTYKLGAHRMGLAVYF